MRSLHLVDCKYCWRIPNLIRVRTADSQTSQPSGGDECLYGVMRSFEAKKSKGETSGPEESGRYLPNESPEDGVGSVIVDMPQEVGLDVGSWRRGPTDSSVGSGRSQRLPSIGGHMYWMLFGGRKERSAVVVSKTFGGGVKSSILLSPRIC